MQLAHVKTASLYTMTHAVLMQHSIGIARAYLDELSRRSDNRWLLCSATAYGITGAIAPVLQDRIDLCNSHANEG